VLGPASEAPAGDSSAGSGVNGGAIGPILLSSDGSQSGTIVVRHEERKILMDGPEVFRHAVQRMSEVTTQVLARAGLTVADIDLFVYHQANRRITQAVGERLSLPTERVVDCIEYFGNSSTATLPIGLVTAIEDGRLRPGSLVLLCAFGSGLTWGAGVVRW
jgi:3-oxoacyl-[acyl-carrier-protein] synthase-3